MSKERNRKHEAENTAEGIRNLSPLEQYIKTMGMVVKANEQVLSGDEIANRGIDVLLGKLSAALPEFKRVLEDGMGRGVVFAVLTENLKFERKVLSAKSKKEKPEPKSWQKMDAKYVRSVIYNFNMDGRLRTFLPVAQEEGMKGTTGVPDFLQRGERRMINATRAFLTHQIK